MAIQASKPNSRIFLLLGIILAALAFGGVLFALRQSSAGVAIVVAKTQLAAGATVTADDVTTASVPAAAAPADAYTSAASVVGKTTSVAVAPNTPMVPAFFSAPPLAATTTTSSTGTPVSLESQITKGDVAIAIPTTGNVSAADGPATDSERANLAPDVLAAGYYIQPGDHIDIMINVGNSGGGYRYAFQDVPVLRVGVAGSSSSASPTVLVVEVPRNQAEQLTALVMGAGHPYVVRYVLRPQSEWGKLAPDNSSYTPNYVPSTGPGVPAPPDTTITPGEIDIIFGH